MHPILVSIGFASLAAAAGYLTVTLLAIPAWRLRRWPKIRSAPPPVTILKPLCGAEPGLYDNLRSFCCQDYPTFEIVFGVRDPADPACPIVERLRAEFPTLPIKLVSNPKLYGSNRKVSNLINMLPHATHDLLVMSDSDALVDPGYLATVTAPLLERDIGLVTCLYHAIPTRAVWSRLGAMYVNEWYMPMVRLSWVFGYRGYVSGQTLCMRHSTLRSIGGFHMLADQLAEDHRLGQLVQALNLKIELSPYVVKGEHHEPDLGSVVRHELRWMRTIRALRPRSFLGIFLTFSLPMALLGLVLAASAPASSSLAWGLFGGAVIARVALHLAHRIGNGRAVSDLWLVPLCDLMILWVWCRSLFTSRVAWRNDEFDVDANGVMHPLR